MALAVICAILWLTFVRGNVWSETQWEKNNPERFSK